MGGGKRSTSVRCCVLDGDLRQSCLAVKMFDYLQ